MTLSLATVNGRRKTDLGHLWSGRDPAEMERRYNAYGKLVQAVRYSSTWMRVAYPCLARSSLTRSLADVVRETEASNAALLRSLGEDA